MSTTTPVSRTATTRRTMRAAIAAATGLIATVAVVLMPVATTVPLASAVLSNHCEPGLSR